jgi:PAS domain S-box-containing protein
MNSETGASRQRLAERGEPDGLAVGSTVPAAHAGPRARILLAVEDQEVRDDLYRILAESYEVEAVGDAAAALARALRTAPDLVLIDLGNSADFIEALRRASGAAGIPAILLSADPREEEAGCRAGDRTDKRSSARELLARVEARLELARFHCEAREREQFIEQIGVLAPVVLSVFDLDAERATFVTQNVAVLLGYTCEELEGMTGSALCPSEDIPRYRACLARCARLADAEVIEAESRFRHRNGQWRWLRFRSTPFRRGEQGEVRQIAIAATDVTACKHADEAFRVSEQRFRRYFELGLIGMAIASLEKGCVEVNDEICRMLGYGRDELLGKTWAELTHPDDLAADMAQFERVIAGEIDSYTSEKRWIRKDRQVIDSTISVSCVRRESGAVDYFVVLVQDITEKKQAAQALAKANVELERRVADRTRQLMEVNEELRREIADRKRAQMESAVLKDVLAADLAAMTRLHDFRTRLLASTKVRPLLEEVLHAIMALQGADFGLIELYNEKSGALEIVAQCGFEQQLLQDFAVTCHDALARGRVLQSQERMIIEDVEKDPVFAAQREIVVRAGVRAVQSTPLFSRRGQPLGVVSTQFRYCHRPSDRDLRLTDLYAMYAEDMIERKRSEAAVLQYQQELQALTARLIKAQETDSQYLARELHDVFSQRLAVLGMELGALAGRVGGSSPELGERLLEFTTQVGALAKDIHRVSRQLHPAILDDLGLAAALRSECVAFSEQYGVRAEFCPGEITPDIPDDVSLCLYRVAQECLRNAGKHAKATQVRIGLLCSQDDIAMEIADSGGGFNPEEIKRNRGLGLISMEERVRLVNGALFIRSEPGKGTLVRVRVPMQSRSL